MAACGHPSVSVRADACGQPGTAAAVDACGHPSVSAKADASGQQRTAEVLDADQVALTAATQQAQDMLPERKRAKVATIQEQLVSLQEGLRAETPGR